MSTEKKPQPYYLYTNGVLKLVDREEPSYFDHLDKNKYHNACEVWADYINALPSIAVSDDLKKVFVEGKRYEEGKDFRLDYNYPMGESLGQEQYASIMQMKYGTMALPVNTLQEEDQTDIWMGAIKIIEDGEFQRTKYKEVLEQLKSKYHITRK